MPRVTRCLSASKRQEKVNKVTKSHQREHDTVIALIGDLRIPEVGEKKFLLLVIVCYSNPRDILQGLLGRGHTLSAVIHMQSSFLGTEKAILLGRHNLGLAPLNKENGGPSFWKRSWCMESNSSWDLSARALTWCSHCLPWATALSKVDRRR